MPQRLSHSSSVLKSFEVQTYRHGKWSVDSVFDDHQLAVFEARRMDESGRFGGVRVVEETWDPNTNNTKTRTVFRDQAYHRVNQEILDQHRAKRQQKTDSVKRKVDRTESYRTTRVETQRARIRKKSNPVRLIAITIGIVLLAMVAGAFLERIEHLF